VQPIERLLVVRIALTLVDDGAIPEQAEGLEGGEDGGIGPGNGAVCIQILDAHQPGAVVGPRIGEAANGGDQ
jgi:hypothetical protein